MIQELSMKRTCASSEGWAEWGSRTPIEDFSRRLCVPGRIFAAFKLESSQVHGTQYWSSTKPDGTVKTSRQGKLHWAYIANVWSKQGGNGGTFKV